MPLLSARSACRSTISHKFQIKAEFNYHLLREHVKRHSPQSVQSLREMSVSYLAIYKKSIYITSSLSIQGVKKVKWRCDGFREGILSPNINDLGLRPVYNDASLHDGATQKHVDCGKRTQFVGLAGMIRFRKKLKYSLSQVGPEARSH